MDMTQRELGYEGARRAESHANRVVDTGWSTKARLALEGFLVVSGAGATFVTSDAARWCLANGLPDPPDSRAFGNMIRKAAQTGMIRDTGRRPRVGCHGREVVEWEVMAFFR